MKWNEQLRHERKSQGWTQSLLAEKIGTNTSTVNRWENGCAFPSPFYRERLAELLGHNFEDSELFRAVLEIHKNTSEKALPPIAKLSAPAIQTEASLLVDPIISQAQGNATSLLRRDDLLRQVKECFLAEDHLTSTVLHGLPGSGKTVLAAALAADKQIQTHFHDGILWAALGPHPNVLGQLARWGKLLGVIPSQVKNINSREDWHQALQAAIGSRRFLLIIDDAWTIEDALAFQIGSPQCAYLLTTRLSQVAPAFTQKRSIVVPRLKEADGLALLAHFVPQLVEQDPEGARALVQAMDGLPLALNLMGRSLAFPTFTELPQPLQAALAELRDTKLCLRVSKLTTHGRDPLNLTETMPLSLYATIAVCNQQLSPQANATLCALAIFPPKPESFSQETALAMSHQPVEVLETLLDAGLLESYTPGRYSLHQTIVDYARSLSEVPAAHQRQVGSLSEDSQPHERDTPVTADHSFSLQSLRDDHPRHKRHTSTVQPSNRHLQHPLLMGSIIFLLALLVSIAVLLAFTLISTFPLD